MGWVFFFSSRRRHTRLVSDWSSDVCSSDLLQFFDYFQSILTIAIAAVLISFILGYPVSWLENSFSRYGMKRPQAVFCIMALTVGIVAIGGVILTPLLLDQIQSFATGLPVWIESGDRSIRQFLRWLAQNNDYMVNLDLQLESLMGQAISQLSRSEERRVGKECRSRWSPYP